MSNKTVLFVNAIRPATFRALEAYEQASGEKLRAVVIVDSNIADSIKERNSQKMLDRAVTVVLADFDSPKSMRGALEPYFKDLWAVTCQYENSILELKKIVPYLPYLPTPTEKSLEWATEKKLMRAQLEAYDKTLVPNYFEIRDLQDETIAQVEAAIKYPMIIKPSGLEGSLLVSLVHNREEFVKTVRFTSKEIQKAYNTWIKRQTPSILVEEFMDGDMYSVDTYIDAQGICRHTPPVKVITGRKVGFDDFSGYMQTLPAGLSTTQVKAAETAAAKACHALGLRSVTVHTELMHLPEGWKIIELGPRTGGYRHELLSLAYGINHFANDIVNRAGEVPTIPTKLNNHTAFFNLYAHDEGRLEGIDGLDEIEQLPSFVSLKHVVGLGEPVCFAKNNGDPILHLVLSHPDKTQFEADVATMQECLQFHVRPVRKRQLEPAKR